MPETTRLLVLYGGRSAEHEISCISARHVLRAADPNRFDVVPIGITRDGQWVDATPLIEATDRDAPALPSPDLAPPADRMAEPSFFRLETTAPRSEAATVIFPVLHGPGGEDGTIQGMAEVWGIPCVGAGVLSSALCMDKWAAKEALGFHGIAQTPWLGARATAIGPAWFDLVSAELGFPLFVKPANLGSSIGVSKAENRSSLVSAVELALGYDDRIVVEAGVAGREIEVAVLGNDEPEASVPGEIATNGVVYDFARKYESDEVRLLIPAPIEEVDANRIRALALRVFLALGVSGMARVDFFYCTKTPVHTAASGEPSSARILVNEVNTVPGFTPISMYPSLWEASGVPPQELINRLVDLAVERHDRRSTRRTSR